MRFLDKIFSGGKKKEVKPMTDEQRAAAIAKIEQRLANEEKYPEGIDFGVGVGHHDEPEAMGNYYRDTERIPEPAAKVDNDQEGNLAA
jgi:hypothetical protein